MTALRHDVAHLGHAELFTPEPERSLRFFVDVLGLTETGRQGDSVYLRTWDDYEQFSLKLTAREVAGTNHYSILWTVEGVAAITDAVRSAVSAS